MTEITSAIQVIPLERYVLLSIALFSIGLLGVLFRRNTIIMIVAAAEVAVGLSIIVMMKRNIDSIDINLLNRLKW
jgi:NADH-quinone oxidoreductase subunit K